eukprot:s1215_g24.t1
MASFVDGREVDVDDIAQWSSLQPVGGNVIEVSLLSSSLAVTEDVWAAFFIVNVTTRMDGSLVVAGRLLGCTDSGEMATIESMGEDGIVHLHLCLSRPCLDTEAMVGIHVTTVRIWDAASFSNCDYVTNDKWTALKKWQKDLAGSSTAGKRAPRKPAVRGTGPSKGAESKRAKIKETPAPGGSGLPDDMRTRLKEKLSKAKKTEGAGVKAGRAEEADDEDETAEEVDSSSPEREELRTGTHLGEGRPSRPRRRGDRDTVEEAAPPAIKDISMKSLSGQLAMKALQTTQEQKKKKEKKKGKKTEKKDVLQALSKILTKTTGEKSKEKDKNKRKRKRRVLEDGTIKSCSSSSDSSSTEEDNKADSETDLEAPMRKRSRDSPGSVLSLLVTHVKEQMEQAALTELPHGGTLVTGGVKLATYFALHIKPVYQGHLRELREMHTLAATMDLLRKGDIARVGDSLAARFMALHQSLIDNNWHTAKFMELHSLEETSAGSAAIVLASRRHSRLVDKVQGKGNGSWGSWTWPGRGRGKGGWKGYGDNNSPVKGEKGKGKDRGKKGKGRGANTWDDKTAEWGRAKEAPPEK